jgi:hypothetical protein
MFITLPFAEALAVGVVWIAFLPVIIRFMMTNVE